MPATRRRRQLGDGGGTPGRTAASGARGRWARVVEAVEPTWRRGRRRTTAPSSPEGFDAVIVGLHRDFDFARLAVASAAVRAGARLIGTNTDSTYPTPTGLQPGGGSILAAIATAADTEPVIGGKPHQPMADLIVERTVGHVASGRSTRRRW